ncbi:MAG: hypothetical protein RR334_00625, partial [Clostridia bacterium]
LVMICVIPLFFAGCGKTTKSIDLSVYFNNKVTYSYLNGVVKSGENKLPSYIKNHMPADRYCSFEFSGNPSWLYGIYVDYITFEITANETMEIQFDFTFSNLTHGDQGGTSESPIQRQSFIVNAQKGKTVKTKLMISDTVYSKSTTAKINFSVTNQEIFRTNGAINNFMYTFGNFEMFAYHK